MKTAFSLSIILIAATSALYLSSTDPSTELQQIANGMFEQVSLADPTTLVPCFTGNTPQQTVDFLTNLTDTLANQQYLKVANIVLNYKKNLPVSVTQCLGNSTEFQQAASAYGTANLTLLGLIQKMEQYIIANVNTIHSSFVELDN